MHRESVLLKRVSSAVVLAACAIAAAGSGRFGGVHAEAPRSYAWYAEVASIDPAASAMTVKVKTRDAVRVYVGQYKADDKLMLVWVPIKGEADTIVYAPKYDVMKGVNEGYILPVEFVSADATGHTLTVKTTIPDTIFQSVKSLRPGQWVKVTSPMQQPKDVATLTMAAASEKPDLKPPAEPARTASASGGMRGGRGASDLSGQWTLEATIAGNALSNECTLQQEGQKITGSCTGPRGTGEISGEIAGDMVTLSFGMGGYELVYTGTLEAGGSSMQGSVGIAGVSGDFTGKKQ